VYRGGIKLMFIYAAYMPLFLTVAEIYGRKVSKFWKRIVIFYFFGPPCRNPLDDIPHQNVCRCVPYISDHIW